MSFKEYHEIRRFLIDVVLGSPLRLIVKFLTNAGRYVVASLFFIRSTRIGIYVNCPLRVVSVPQFAMYTVLQLN